MKWSVSRVLWCCGLVLERGKKQGEREEQVRGKQVPLFSTQPSPLPSTFLSHARVCVCVCVYRCANRKWSNTVTWRGMQRQRPFQKRVQFDNTCTHASPQTHTAHDRQADVWSTCIFGRCCCWSSFFLPSFLPFFLSFALKLVGLQTDRLAGWLWCQPQQRRQRQLKCSQPCRRSKCVLHVPHELASQMSSLSVVVCLFVCLLVYLFVEVAVLLSSPRPHLALSSLHLALTLQHEEDDDLVSLVLCPISS